MVLYRDDNLYRDYVLLSVGEITPLLSSFLLMYFCMFSVKLYRGIMKPKQTKKWNDVVINPNNLWDNKGHREWKDHKYVFQECDDKLKSGWLEKSIPKWKILAKSNEYYKHLVEDENFNQRLDKWGSFSMWPLYKDAIPDKYMRHLFLETYLELFEPESPLLKELNDVVVESTKVNNKILTRRNKVK